MKNMEINDKTYRLITRRGFVDEFWEDLRLCRMDREDCSRREVYESLETLYEGEFGERKFPSFDAFSKHVARICHFSAKKDKCPH